MTWEALCKLSDIPNNTGAAALINDHQIAVFKVDDQAFAIDNYDPFSKANVLARGIVCTLKGEICVASPLYKQHFSLRSGQCMEDENICIRSYPLRINGDTIEFDKSALELAAA